MLARYSGRLFSHLQHIPFRLMGWQNKWQNNIPICMSAILPLNLRQGKLIDSGGSCVYPAADVGKNSSMLWLSEKAEIHRKGNVYQRVWYHSVLQRLLSLSEQQKPHNCVNTAFYHCVFLPLLSRTNQPNTALCWCR